MSTPGTTTPTLKTDGVSPKVPAQAIVTVLTFVLFLFGIELSVELSGALATLLGIAGGFLAPAARLKRV